LSSIACPQPVAAEYQRWTLAGAAERVLSAVLLVILAPLLFMLAVATCLLSGESPWIAHRRVGQFGAELWVLKFRTMWSRRKQFAGLTSLFAMDYIDDEEGPALKGPDDGRVASSFAKFCRRHSLDELPQLLLVVTGRMSLVGPRPVTHSELHEIYGSEAHEIVRMKPGLTGLWQVSGRNQLSTDQRRALDLQFVRNPSEHLFRIVLRTFPEILWGRNTW
jgi:exopolysaccharide production protein ExoY